MTNRSLAQTLALVFGVAFLGAGVLGFIPGITTDLGDIKFAGKDSPSELFGIFQVSNGLLVGSGDDANFVPINTAGDWLHLVLAVGLLGGWWISKGSDEIVGDRTATAPPAPPAP